jgi:Na+-driven multidrug efflux pump
MMVISLWLIRVPFAYLLVDRWQADAIWWSFPVAYAASLAMSLTYYRIGSWRKVRMGVATRAAPVPGA